MIKTGTFMRYYDAKMVFFECILMLFTYFKEPKYSVLAHEKYEHLKADFDI